MLRHLHKTPSLILATIKEWRRDNPSILAAALAYYAFFSIIPVLIIAAAIGTLFLGQAAAEGQLESTLTKLFGERMADVIQSALVDTYSQKSGIVVTAAVAVLIFGASYFFVQLRNALNIIWRVRERKKMFAKFVEGRLVSLILVTGMSVLLLLWLAASASLSALIILSRQHGVVGGLVLEIANFALIFVLSVFLFAMVYKLLPSVRLTWEDVWLGALVTAFLFAAGVQVVAFYLSRISLASVYGVAGSLVGLLLWLYISAQIFMFGAVFTRVYASRHGSRKTRRV